MKIVILGLSVTSSWGNGHATTWRGLMRELVARGHDVLFLERDVSWYAANRDMPVPPFGRTVLYDSLDELASAHEWAVREADLVIVGSYVPDGVTVSEWVLRIAQGVTAFYDIDTPVTLAKLARGDHEYLTADLIPRFQLYLSFTGGPTLERLERELGAPMARALYCGVDPSLYFPTNTEMRWDLGYMGTWSADRQPAVERLLLEPARRHADVRCVVAGPQYPPDVDWPANIERIEHLPPAGHAEFYSAQRYTLNVTRTDMVAAGHSPSVRIFEAAACGTPIISDWWEGLDSVLTPGEEILIAHDADDVLRILAEVGEHERKEVAQRARERVLREHTAAHRAAELEGFALALLQRGTTA